MTACGRKRNVFRSVVIEARIESRLAAILAADVAGRIVKTAVTVPWSDLRALSTPRAAPWKSSALWPIRNPDDRRIEFRIGINVGDIIVDACATVNGGEGAFSEVAGQAHV
jgi:class 3 adenylate cyclase